MGAGNRKIDCNPLQQQEIEKIRSSAWVRVLSIGLQLSGIGVNCKDCTRSRVVIALVRVDDPSSKAVLELNSAAIEADRSGSLI